MKSGQTSENEDEIMDDDKRYLDQDESGDDSDENDNMERNNEMSFNIASKNREPDLENEGGISVEDSSSVREELRKIEEDER